MRYHNLLDIGRDIVEQKVKRPLPERMLREGLRQVVPRPAVFRALTQVGLVLRPFLPEQVSDRFYRNRSEQNCLLKP